MTNKYLNYIDIVDTEEEIYALISPLNDPNLYIPIRGKVIDLDINEKKSRYIIQIIEFYEDFDFVKEHFIGKNWTYARRSSTKDNNIEERKSPNKLRYYNDLNTLNDIYHVLSGEDVTEVIAFDESTKEREFQDYKERHYLSIDPICVFTEYEHMIQVFNELTEFVIVEKLRDLRTYLSRKNYTQTFRLNDKNEVMDMYLKMFGKKSKKILDKI